MRSKISIIRLTVFIFLLFAGSSIILAGRQDISAVRALQHFDAGEFREAEKIFSVLLAAEPGNPMLNYYYGASRTENGHFNDRDLEYLLKAGESMTPERLHYYLGIQYHARNNWEQALKFYNQFRLSVPENEQTEMKLVKKIQQCYDQVNPYQNDMAIQVQEKETAEVEVPDREPVLPVQEKFEEENILAEGISETSSTFAQGEPPEISAPVNFSFDREALPDLPGVKSTFNLPAGEPIDFQINNDITYLFGSQFHTTEGKALFGQGQLVQKQIENALDEIEKLRKAYRNATNLQEKAALGEKILALETDLYDLKDESTHLFSESRKKENDYWANAGSTEKHNFLIQQEKIEAALNGSKEETKSISPAEEQPVVLPPEFFSEIYDKPAAGTPEQKELVYKIQIGAYSSGIPAFRKRLFDKLALFRKIDTCTDENGVVVYTTGSLTNQEDAVKMQNQVRQEGVEDAFIVPYFKGKRITLEQAKKIEAGDDF